MPGFFIPARNSRHRTACFALYRALLQQAPRIRLPDDLATARGPVNPIKHLIRRSFQRNRNDTSPRLVFPALKAGYQILALLRSAADHSPSTSSTPSPSAFTPNADYASVISFLRTRLDERNRTLDAKKLHPPHSRTPPRPSSAPRPDAIPLLVNVTPAPTPQNPNPKPLYEIPSRPRPLAELGGTGRRKVPRLDMASDMPFLRIAKPQPPVLSRVLTQKIRKRVARGGFTKYLYDDALPEADWEDEWERAVAKLMEAEQRRRSSSPRQRRGEGGGGQHSEVREENSYSVREEARAIRGEFRAGDTFRHAVWHHGILYLQSVLSREREYHVARADAMRRLIDEETALAVQEKAERDVERRKRWEAKMLELHGEGWRELFPNLKESKSPDNTRGSIQNTSRLVS
ncbi:hypothetical protein GGR53DRAFT_290312 [Hypoxylon sp. FL1150]|nr:hypothetical protein GGR53DRAFT_290312 [Hypoxylon sp. FL1150]